jgi:hypothetical protein
LPLGVRRRTVNQVTDTVLIAALGLAATLISAWMTAHLQRRGDREARFLDAKIRVFGECSDSLYEYARAMFNRARSRLDGPSETEREDFRQEAYRSNARARSAIGQASILTGDEGLREALEQARHSVGVLNDATSRADLTQRQQDVYHLVKQALERARTDLMH